MASYLDKAQVNTAITENTKLDLGHQHITTADFMQLNVSAIHELVPGSKIDVKMESFARLNPLVVPTFGRASMRHRAFFVPFRTIFRGWNDMITDSPHVGSSGYSGGQVGTLLSNVPTVTTQDLVEAFVNFVGQNSIDGSGMVYAVQPNQQNSNWDITYTTGGVTSYYCYTVKGRQCLKILESLGYKLDFQYASKTSNLSALPLLALAKIYADWYYPNQYTNRTEYDLLVSLCNTDVHGSVQALTGALVNTILSMCSYVQYDSDLFVSAFDTPNQPSTGTCSSDFKLVNIDTVGSAYVKYAASSGGAQTLENVNAGYVGNYSGTANGTSQMFGGADAPFITPSVLGTIPGSSNVMTSPTPISEYLLHSLHALTDYMKRHQLAGSRAMDRYLARFGKALPAEKLNRCNYLGAAMQDIQIGDIMSTADTVGALNSSGGSTGAQLGTYAGKGISYGNGHFDFSTDEYGYFIILTSIVPATGYFQGIDPMVMRTTKLDFWTPEFDSLGNEPITAASVYIPFSAGIMTSGNPYSQIFGFVPRYASYKSPTCSDRLTGNFRVASINGGNFLNGGNSWHLMRTFDGVNDFNRDYANVVHSPWFVNGGADFSQYKRLFYEDDADSPDNFTVIHNFEIAEYAPMKALYDSYEFEDKGKKVTLDANGVKMN